MDPSRRKPRRRKPGEPPFVHPGDDKKLSRALGEEGMDRVASHSAAEWFPHAQKVILRICDLYPGRSATGEQLSNAVRHFYCEPEKPQAWGSLTNWAKRAGLIVLTGERRPMARPSSHGRTTDVYRIVPRPGAGSAYVGPDQPDMFDRTPAIADNA